jgi:hypothetical protein
MPFMVIHSTADGTSCHQPADAIDEAALLVERLRNQDGIEDIRIYRMEEISFAFRPYYKVELGMPERQAAPVSEVAGPAPVEPAPEPADADVPPAPSDVAVEAAAVGPMHAATDGELGPNGRRGLFGR